MDFSGLADAVCKEDIDSMLKQAWILENKHPRSTIEHYIVQWNIEQFDYFPKLSSKSISSPRFTLDASKTAWYFSLIPVDNKDNKSALHFRRQRKDQGPSVVSVSYRFGIMLSENETEWFDQQNLRSYNMGYSEKVNIPSVYEELNKCSDPQNGNLILRCEMYVTYEIKQSGDCLTPADYDLFNLSCDLVKLMRSTKSSDCFVKNPHAVTTAHKVILAARSPVFLEKLRKDMPSNDTVLENVSTSNIINLLLFMYTGNFNQVAESGTLDVEFYECAQEFDVSELKCLLAPKYLYTRSTLEVEELEFTWHIEKFSSHGVNCGKVIKSPEFSSSNSDTHWTLTLHTKHTSQKPYSLSIYAEPCNRPKVVHFVLDISLVDEHGVLQKTQSTESMRFHKYKDTYGFQDYLEDFLTDNGKYNFLTDDTLKIHSRILLIASKEMVDEHTLLGLFFSKVSSFLNLSDDLRKIFKSGKFSDVTVKTRSSLIPAHIPILLARSEVLASKFMKDAPKDGILEMLDVDPDIVTLMIDHAYSGILKQAPTETLVRLLRASEKYSFSSLSLMCSHILGSNVNTENFFELIELGAELRSVHLAGKCLSFAQKDSEKIKKSERWGKWREEQKEIAEVLVKRCFKRAGND